MLLLMYQRVTLSGSLEQERITSAKLNPGPTTFVFVTPRRWVRKRINIEKWANEKRAEKLWKDVRVVDGIMLEDWLDQCPVAGSSR
ncbi:MAG: hypothetical protein DMG84_04435 [Acidobacteria bacterium]|nr:MAG: hypothetical protein DMG84_04435 [Acidobacteriota bacterium]